MIETVIPPPRRSPWLSVWLNPRATIDAIVAGNPRRHVLLLAAFGGIWSVVSRVVDAGFLVALLDWQVVAALACAGAILGVVDLYLYGLLYGWVGKLFGGRAGFVDMRAVIAWGFVPGIIGLAICLAFLAGVKLSGRADAPEVAGGWLAMGLQGIVLALGVWSLIATLVMLARLQKFGFWRTLVSSVIAWLLAAALMALPLALLIRTFAFQPFSMPSGSMEPTLLVGDYFFVSKFRYGYSHYSFPFSPRLFSGRLLATQPQLGDLVVFRLPKDDSIDYVKRLVGLPGDRIQMIDGALHVNGKAVKREPAEDYLDAGQGPVPVRVKRWHETLPNGASYDTIQLHDTSFYDNTPPYLVPPGHCFVIGDNRQNSQDSRVLSAVGYIPFENLIGRVEIIFFSLEPSPHPAVRSERIGMPVR